MGGCGRRAASDRHCERSEAIQLLVYMLRWKPCVARKPAICASAYWNAAALSWGGRVLSTILLGFHAIFVVVGLRACNPYNSLILEIY